MSNKDNENSKPLFSWNIFDLQGLQATEISQKITVILFPCETNTERNVPETEIMV